MLSSATNIEASNSFAPVQLLAQIAEDQAFRERLESNPIAAFAELGVELDASQLPAEVNLPKMEAFFDTDSVPTPNDPIIRWSVYLD